QILEREQSEAALSDANRKLMLTSARLEHSEREAQALSDRLALGTEAGGIGVWDYDIAADILWRDERMYELFDLSRSEADADYRIWIERIHPEDRHSVENLFLDCIKSGAPYASEYRIILRDGAVRTLRSNGKVSRNSTGRTARMAGITYDVTDLRQREQAAASRALERFQRVVEAAPNAMVLINEAGKIDMVNTEAERVFGFSRSELLGSPVENLLPDRFKEHHPVVRRAFFTEPAARRMGIGRDLFGRRKDGTE